MILTFSTQKIIEHKIRNFSKDEIYLEANIDGGAIYPKIFIPLSEGAGKPQE